MEVAQFGTAENLDTFRGEIIIETGEGEAGAVDRGFADDAVEAGFAGHQFEAEGVGVVFEKLPDAGWFDCEGGHGVYMLKLSPR